MSPRLPPSRRPKVAAPRDAYRDAHALLVIDQTRLHGAAWAEYHRAQKAHEKAARDLHRHEEVDTPAYEAWLHRTFPVLMTTLRRLEQEVAAKGQRVQFTRAMAAFTGRSAKKLWQEQKENETNPAGPDAEPTSDDARKSERHRPDPDDDFFADDDDEPRAYRGRGQAYAGREAASAPQPARSAEARDIYRRLVQRLHPDRGGAWTPARQRLWHEVQQAWEANDADWLARLEVEWETANEVLSPGSPLSRLRRAITELLAARRDTERKLRLYRKTPPWRFTLSEKKRAVLHRRTEEILREDVEFLELQLAHLNKTIAAWEEPTFKSRPRHTTPDW